MRPLNPSWPLIRFSAPLQYHNDSLPGSLQFGYVSLGALRAIKVFVICPVVRYNGAMENDILFKIVAAEKEIQENIERQRGKSREWLDEVKKQAEASVIAEEIRLKESLLKAIQDAREDAGKRAAQILDDAIARAEAMKGMDQGFLSSVTIRHIKKILPGEDRDSPHVEG